MEDPENTPEGCRTEVSLGMPTNLHAIGYHPRGAQVWSDGEQMTNGHWKYQMGQWMEVVNKYLNNEHVVGMNPTTGWWFWNMFFSISL